MIKKIDSKLDLYFDFYDPLDRIKQKKKDPPKH